MTRHTVRTRIVHILLLVGLVAGIQGLTIVKPPVVQAQQSPFLTTPYYGTKSISAYVDHSWGVDDHILFYDGRVANVGNGVCGFIGGQPRAYFTQPAGGECLWYDGHNGTDFADHDYEPVLAAASGTVIFAGWQDTTDPGGRNVGFGLFIEIEHVNGYTTRYGHLSVVAVEVDDHVDAGEIIGTSGNTGVSTGAHLHFEVRDNNWNVVDPFGGAGSDSLWMDGEWAGHPLPAPAEAGSIIIDDGDTGFSKECIDYPSCPYWYRDETVGCGGDMWYTQGVAGTGPDYQANWYPTVPTANQGMYGIDVHIPSDHHTTWWAKYIVGLGHTARVDQAGLSNQWVSIGTYFFSPTTASVKVTDETGDWDELRYIGVDAVRFVRLAPTYLPDVRASGGWNSAVVIRSNGGDAVVHVHYLDSGGGGLCIACHGGIPARGIWVMDDLSWCSGASDVRSAVVYASQDVSVVVENRKTGEATNYNGIAAADPFNPGWGQVGTSIYAPSVKHGLYGRSSHLYVLNTGSDSATVTPGFRARDNGSSYSCDSFTVSPQGRYVYDPSSCGLPTGWLYGAELASTQPLAVVVVEQNDSGAALAATSNAFSAGDTSNFAPLIKNNYWGNSTSIVVQNVGSDARVYVYYYDRDQSWSTNTSYYLRSDSSHVFPAPSGMPSGVGSARVTASQPLVTTVYEYELSGDWRMQHSGFLGGSRTVVLPQVYKNYVASGKTWRTGFQVQNVGGDTANVTVQYYDTSGNTNANWDESDTIQSYRAATFYAPSNPDLPNGFQGSAIVTADQDIVVEVNVTHTGSGDGGMSYNGINR